MFCLLCVVFCVYKLSAKDPSFDFDFLRTCAKNHAFPMATSDEEFIKQLREVFDLCDELKCGIISVNQLRDIVRKHFGGSEEVCFVAFLLTDSAYLFIFNKTQLLVLIDPQSEINTSDFLIVDFEIFIHIFFISNASFDRGRGISGSHLAFRLCHPSPHTYHMATCCFVGI